jgi:hypothetical protein
MIPLYPDITVSPKQGDNAFQLITRVGQELYRKGVQRKVIQAMYRKLEGKSKFDDVINILKEYVSIDV